MKIVAVNHLLTYEHPRHASAYVTVVETGKSSFTKFIPYPDDFERKHVLPLESDVTEGLQKLIDANPAKPTAEVFSEKNMLELLQEAGLSEEAISGRKHLPHD